MSYDSLSRLLFVRTRELAWPIDFVEDILVGTAPDWKLISVLKAKDLKVVKATSGSYHVATWKFDERILAT